MAEKPPLRATASQVRSKPQAESACGTAFRRFLTYPGFLRRSLTWPEIFFHATGVRTHVANANVRGGPVLSHVQEFADATVALGATTWGTYPGHQPHQTRAVDIFVPTGDQGVSLGDRITAFALANWSRFGLQYVIFRQRINSGDGRGWRSMPDRGSRTANHYDHVHLSFQASPPPTPGGTSAPAPPPPSEDVLSLTRDQLIELVRVAVDSHADARTVDIKKHAELIRNEILREISKVNEKL